MDDDTAFDVFLGSAITVGMFVVILFGVWQIFRIWSPHFRRWLGRSD